MSLFTKDEFKRISNSNKDATKSFSQIVKEAKLAYRYSSTTSVFLSHAHADSSLIEHVVAFLKGLNASIYIDWLDETMPDKPNGITASKIKSKIQENDKFLFLATETAIASKWCNWEVGIGDAYKLNSDKICLLPIAENNGTWQGNEYLQIYPRVEQVSGHNTIFRLNYPDGNQAWFDEWLKK